MARTLHFGRWHFRLTPTRYVLILLTLIMMGVAVVRLVTGLGAVTNMSDQWPWGLWIGFDLLSGIAPGRRRLQHSLNSSHTTQG